MLAESTGHPVPDFPADVERFQGPARSGKARFAEWVLRLGGWKRGLPPPQIDKCVVLAVPHTTWMDGFWMNAYAWWWGLNILWMIKASHGFIGILRRIGAVAVDRNAPQGLVTQMAEEFARSERMMVAIPPEGTRSLRDFWKSGFYHIAREADVPVCLSYLDYEAREAGFGPCFKLTGDMQADMDLIRRFYRDVHGAHPERFTFPRLRGEELSEEEARARVQAP